MDFVSDSLSGGRLLKYLTVADDFSHECVDIAVDFGISGQYVTRVLDQAALFRGYPRAVRTDNGPEFTSRAFMAWAQAHGIRHILIQPGRPMQNGFIESFNGKFRDEHPSESWFQTLHQARMAVAIWHTDYNEVRPHSSLGTHAAASASPSCIASVLAMQLNSHQPTIPSINLQLITTCANEIWLPMTRCAASGVPRPRPARARHRRWAARRRALLDAPPSHTLKRKRDRAILSMLLYYALQCEELSKQRVVDYNQERRGVPHLRVHGKGGKLRFFSAHPPAELSAPQSWLHTLLLSGQVELENTSVLTTHCNTITCQSWTLPGLIDLL